MDAMDGLEESGGEGMANRDSERTTYLGDSVTLTSATEGDCSGDCTRYAATLVGSSPMKGGSKGVVACCASLSSWLRLLALVMSMGRAPDSLMRSSKMVRAGDGGIESMRLTGAITGLAKAEEAAELARDRNSSGKKSRSGDSEVRRDFHLVDMVEICDPIRETPFMDRLSERRFLGEYGMSMPTSLKS